MSGARAAATCAWCAALLGGGLALWYLVVPSEERRKEMLKVMSDDGSAGAERVCTLALYRGATPPSLVM